MVRCGCIVVSGIRGYGDTITCRVWFSLDEPAERTRQSLLLDRRLRMEVMGPATATMTVVIGPQRLRSP